MKTSAVNVFIGIVIFFIVHNILRCLLCHLLSSLLFLHSFHSLSSLLFILLCCLLCSLSFLVFVVAVGRCGSLFFVLICCSSFLYMLFCMYYSSFFGRYYSVLRLPFFPSVLLPYAARRFNCLLPPVLPVRSDDCHAHSL